MITPEQLMAIQAPSHVSVIAGAGTGKTHMLAERYLHHLRQGLTPLEVVAVTFTEKAALELRSRIRERVRTEFAGRPDILAELEAAQISTLHALAARICHEHPTEAEVPQEFTILDGLEKKVRQTLWVNEALKSIPEEEFDVLPYTFSKKALLEMLNDPTLTEQALLPDAEDWKVTLQGMKAAAWAKWQSNPRTLQAYTHLSGTTGPAGDKIEDARQQTLQAFTHLAAGEHQQALELLRSINLRGGSKKNWGEEAFEQVKHHLGTLRDACKENPLLDLTWTEADDHAAEVLPRLRSIQEKVFRHVGFIKRKEQVLEFSDLEIHALKALQHPGVQRHYHKRWKGLLVDEVQDTSPIQARLLELLSATSHTTLVGDPQQSIYAFRGADLRVFQQMQKDLQEHGGQTVHLTESFRTHQGLLMHLNHFAQNAFPEWHQPLKGSRPAWPGNPVQGFVLSYGEHDKPSKTKRLILEAKSLASTLKKMVEQKAPIHDPKTGEIRPIQYGDMAILTRTWDPLTTFHDVLPTLDVPCVHSGGGNLLATREGMDALNLLRFLADPYDDIALLGVLRSPFFAIDDPTLYRLQLQKVVVDQRWWNVLNSASLHETHHATDVLNHLLAMLKTDFPSRILQQADRLTGYTAVLSQLSNPSRRLADWNGVMMLVQELQKHTDNLFDVVRHIDFLEEMEVNVPRPTLDATNAVSLMTIHRAKGLEWPLVVLADLDHQNPGGNPPVVLLHASIGAGFRFKVGKDTQATAIYTAIQEQKKQQEQEELKRLLYVGFTRARDLLLLTSSQPTGDMYHLLETSLRASGVPFEDWSVDVQDAWY